MTETCFRFLKHMFCNDYCPRRPRYSRRKRSAPRAGLKPLMAALPQRSLLCLLTSIAARTKILSSLISILNHD